jgi:peptidyl-prolyl cis-trans isomerase SurA
MTRLATATAWLAAALLAAPASAGEVLDRIAAVVNEDVILLSDVDRQCQDSLAQVPSGLPLDEELGRKRQIRRQALDRLIDELLLTQQIRGAQIEVDAEQVSRYIARLREDNKMSEEQFEAALAHEGKTMDGFKAEVHKMLERQRLMGRELAGKVSVTEKEVEEYYRSTYLEGGGVHKVRASHILFALPENATPEQEQQVRARGEAVLAALRAGADFAETAKKESDDPSGPLGGDLGWFRRGDMVAAFESAAFGLKKGEMTKALVRTQYGYHVILLTGTAEEAPPALDQVSEDIRRRLMMDKQERFQRNWLEDLRRKAFVEIKL